MTRRLLPAVAVVLLACLLGTAGAFIAGGLRDSAVIAYVVFDQQTTRSRIEIMDIPQRLVLPRYAVFGRVDDLNWTPDGTKLVFAAFRSEELRRDVIVLEVTSGEWRWLTSGPADHNTPDVTRDGTQLIVQRHDRAGDSWNLALLDARTGAYQRTLLETRLRNEGRPDPSPDMQQVAFQASGFVDTPLVGVVDTASGEVVWEAAGIGPAWSPDGTLLAYVGATADLADILLADISDGSVRAISVAGVLERSPDWAPDGERLVFSANIPGIIGSHLYTVRVDGSELRRLTPQPAVYLVPVWRP